MKSFILFFLIGTVMVATDEEIKSPHPTVLLNNRRYISQLGLGTDADPLERNEDKAVAAVYEAIKVGYRHFDTAYIYETEVAVGKAIRRAITEGICKREDVFVTTKIYATNLGRANLIAQAKESNENLNIGYIDLLLIHAPFPIISWEEGSPPVFDEEVDVHTESYKALEEVQEMGITKSIGVSNYNIKLLKELLKVAKIVPACVQVESTPYLPNTNLINFCKRKGIVFVAYAPFGGGWADPSKAWRPLDGLPREPVVVEIAKKHNVTSRMVLLRFHVERGIVVLAKSFNKDHLTENAKAFDFRLDSMDMEQLFAMENGKRSNTLIDLKDHKNYPFGPDDDE